MTITTHTAADAKLSTIAYPVDQVWRVLPGVLDSLGIPVSLSDPAKHLIGNDGLNLRRRLGNTTLDRFIDCGNTQGSPSANSYEVHLAVRTTVSPDPAGSVLSTTVVAMGRPVSFSGDYVRCSSTGALESRIADGARARLRR
jgi:hypothetical protein